MAWKKTKISEFLKERQNRYSPNEANKLGLKRLYKIDFSGKIHLLDGKTTNTNMILVKKGDLVISGINVEKGALAIYTGEEDILATIHYSSYSFDKTKIDIDYLKWFLKSEAFAKVLQTQIKGGIKTELKPKKFLPLEINLPDLPEQIKIRKQIESVIEEIKELHTNNHINEKYLSKLRQSILQEAIQGKLVPQNPNDEPASVLLEKIKKEKDKLIKEGKIKKQKSLPQITEEEKPFELPKGWEWTRVGEIVLFSDYGTSQKAFADIQGVPVLGMGNVNNNGTLNFANTKQLSFESKDLPRLYIQNNNLLFNRTNSYELVGKIALYLGKDNIYTFASYLIRLQLSKNMVPKFANHYFISTTFRKTQIEPEIIQQCGQANFNGTKLKNKLFPVPPLEEQNHIVVKVDNLMSYCDELENKIKQNQKYSTALMDAVLREAFSN